jgi:periplasmic divalent cation tolerance protein
MKPAQHFNVVLVTAPDLRTARRLSRGALAQRLAACASLVPKIESHYWWQGKIARGAEVLILFKTARGRLAALEQFILAGHPYDTPEIVTLRLDRGTERYLAWINASIATPPAPRAQAARAGGTG